MRIVFAEHHTMVRDGLRPFVQQIGPGAEVVEAGNFQEFQQIVTSGIEVDLALLDAAMPGLDLENGIGMVRRHHPKAHAVVLSPTVDRFSVNLALSLGASGYIPKHLSAQAMISALRLIREGERYIPGSLLSPCGGEAAPPHGGGQWPRPEEPNLTSREQQVLGLLRQGLSNKVIANRLGLTEVTVKCHLNNAYRKLNVKNRVQAAQRMVALCG